MDAYMIFLIVLNVLVALTGCSSLLYKWIKRRIERERQFFGHSQNAVEEESTDSSSGPLLDGCKRQQESLSSFEELDYHKKHTKRSTMVKEKPFSLTNSLLFFHCPPAIQSIQDELKKSKAKIGNYFYHPLTQVPDSSDEQDDDKAEVTEEEHVCFERVKQSDPLNLGAEQSLTYREIIHSAETDGNTEFESFKHDTFCFDHGESSVKVSRQSCDNPNKNSTEQSLGRGRAVQFRESMTDMFELSLDRSPKPIQIQEKSPTLRTVGNNGDLSSAINSEDTRNDMDKEPEISTIPSELISFSEPNPFNSNSPLTEMGKAAHSSWGPSLHSQCEPITTFRKNEIATRSMTSIQPLYHNNLSLHRTRELFREYIPGLASSEKSENILITRRDTIRPNILRKPLHSLKYYSPVSEKWTEMHSLTVSTMSLESTEVTESSNKMKLSSDWNSLPTDPSETVLSLDSCIPNSTGDNSPTSGKIRCT
ncbi:unnamed protein product [Calicophoron daubneyi]|uniref:Uncharacterized protein n=1 Tax=Calicophoron daubneyi TaxID=300641 RepID=A0AAV2TTC6_CALDB